MGRRVGNGEGGGSGDEVGTEVLTEGEGVLAVGDGVCG